VTTTRPVVTSSLPGTDCSGIGFKQKMMVEGLHGHNDQSIGHRPRMEFEFLEVLFGLSVYEGRMALDDLILIYENFPEVCMSYVPWESLTVEYIALLSRFLDKII
jgi:hypothetical protein